MDVSIIIVNWNTKRLLLECLSSVFETVKDISFKIWLVDNAYNVEIADYHFNLSTRKEG